jgi:hypothetical protein
MSALGWQRTLALGLDSRSVLTSPALVRAGLAYMLQAAIPPALTGFIATRMQSQRRFRSTGHSHSISRSNDGFRR